MSDTGERVKDDFERLDLYERGIVRYIQGMSSQERVAFMMELFGARRGRSLYETLVMIYPEKLL